MLFIATEWTGDQVRWTNDGHTVHVSASLEDAVDTCDGAVAVLCEPAFYDHDRRQRSVLRDLLASDGHTLISVGAGPRAILEAASGDAKVGSGICRLFGTVTTGSTALDLAAVAGFDWRDVRSALDVAHAYLCHKIDDALAFAPLAAFPPFDDLDTEHRLALGEVDYYRPVLLALALAGAAASNRPTFERYLGLTNGAQIGSMSHAIRTWYRNQNGGVDFVPESKLPWTAYRRAMRWAYHRIKANRATPSQAAA